MFPANILDSAVAAFYHDTINMGIDIVNISSLTLHSINTTFGFPDDSDVSSSLDNEDSDKSVSNCSDVHGIL